MGKVAQPWLSNSSCLQLCIFMHCVLWSFTHLYAIFHENVMAIYESHVYSTVFCNYICVYV